MRFIKCIGTPSTLFEETYYPSSSKNFATTFGAVPPSKSSFIVFGSESNDNTSAGQCNWPHLIQITLPALNLLSVAIVNDEHELSWCQRFQPFCSTATVQTRNLKWITDIKLWKYNSQVYECGVWTHEHSLAYALNFDNYTC